MHRIALRCNLFGLMLLAAASALAAGCGQAPSQPVDLSRNTMVLSDCTGIERCTYVVADRKVVLIVAPQPPADSKATRRYYSMERASDQIFPLLREISGYAGEIHPPFPPEAPIYARSLYVNQTAGRVSPPPDQAYFSAGHDCQKPLAKVRAAVEVPMNLVTALPNWVFANESIARETDAQSH